VPGGGGAAGRRPSAPDGEEHAVEHGLDTEVLAVVSTCVVLWALVSGVLARWSISAPLAFVVLGLVVTHGPVHLVHINPHSSTILSLAEVTLALVLFTDASRVNIHQLRHDLGLPVRLLAIGLPLTIGFGTAAAFGVLPGIGIWVAASVGAGALLSLFAPGAFEFAARIPAKAWLLHQVMPARYKVGTDFNAQSSALSIAELELQIEMVEEISLAI